MNGMNQAWAIGRRIGAAACLVFSMCAMHATQATAQSYPARPVRIVVPAAAGGGLDLAARILANRLTESLGQTALVENRPGANMIVGTDAVAKAAPDGHTLLVVASPALTINPLVLPDLPYNPARDLAPVSLLTSNPFALLVNNNVPAGNVQELVAHLRANPGKLNHASNSASTMLISELFKSLARVEYSDINYKGGVLAAAATAAGETQFCFVDLGSATAPVRAGRVRAFAVTSAQRYKLRPELPTLAESGVPGSAIAWVVLLAPAKTPPEIIARLSADTIKVMALPDTVSRIEAIGSEVVASSPLEAAQALRADGEQWAKLVSERNIKFQR